jgi:hypothetical protein
LLEKCRSSRPISEQELKALRPLKSKRDIGILQPDSGTCTLVLVDTASVRGVGALTQNPTAKVEKRVDKLSKYKKVLFRLI